MLTPYTPRKYETLAGVASAILASYPAFLIANTLFLIRLYGFSRVRAEHLCLTATPKGSAWIVSNGDRINEGFFVHFLITMAIWLFLVLCTFPLILSFLPPKEDHTLK